MSTQLFSSLSRRLFAPLMLGLVGVSLLAAESPASAKPPAVTKGNPRVVMVVEKRGELTIELYAKDAPKTTAHFLDLVKQKFYDGILFHRYVDSFVVQGGDPKSKEVDGKLIADISAEQAGQQYGLGMGGSGKTVPLEAKRPHERGTLGLARSQDPNSGDSQFFFNLKDNHQLDSGYCSFGKVVKGLDVMDKIKQGDRIKSIRLASEKETKPKK